MKNEKASLRRNVGKEKPESVSFMLAEFEQASEFWRQSSERVSTAFNFYLTAGAILVSGLLLLFQSSNNNLRVFIAGVIAASFILLVSGTFLASVIISANTLRAEYIISLNLFWRYFADHDPTII